MLKNSANSLNKNIVKRQLTGKICGKCIFCFIGESIEKKYCCMHKDKQGIEVELNYTCNHFSNDIDEYMLDSM